MLCCTVARVNRYSGRRGARRSGRGQKNRHVAPSAGHRSWRSRGTVMSDAGLRGPTLLGRAREVARLRHLSLSTEESYLLTIRRFIRFRGGRHPREMGVEEIRAYLSHLTIDHNVAASTQNAALAGLLLLHGEYVPNRGQRRSAARSRCLRLGGCALTGDTDMSRPTSAPPCPLPHQPETESASVPSPYRLLRRKPRAPSSRSGSLRRSYPTMSSTAIVMSGKASGESDEPRW
jgi:hypothetical protein